MKEGPLRCFTHGRPRERFRAATEKRRIKIWQEELKEWASICKKRMEKVIKDFKSKLTTTYGFYSDPLLPPRINAFNVLRNVPTTLLLTNPSNAAYHNLCDATTDLPTTLRSLLGLGLNFCVKPESTPPLQPEFFDRFTKDYCRKIHFAADDQANAKKFPDQPEWHKPPFWLPSEWQAPLPDQVPELNHRLCDFETSLRRMFKKKSVPSNLLPSQSAALNWLQLHPEIIVCNTDKNLGPALMEVAKYIAHAHRDHLRDPHTYRRLNAQEVIAKRTDIISQIDSFLTIHSASLSAADSTDGVASDYIREHTKDGLSYMYLMPKIHKPPPLKTRAIISYSGSICYGLAVWIDIQLKKIIPHLPYIAKSSREVVSDLTARRWDPSSRLFTCDATSMYTNIHLKHALPMFENFLSNTELGAYVIKKSNISPGALLHALTIVMSNNLFQFGDTFWLQLTGTAMGTPPAPNYATIYFCIWEMMIIPLFPELAYYRRYIDDGFGVWTPLEGSTPQSDDERFNRFKSLMDEFGSTHTFFQTSTHTPLQWEFSERKPSAIFLDLNLSLDQFGNINSKIYEKDLNLYLYIVPHSCHSLGSIKGTIWGMVHRTKALCTNEADYEPFLRKCYTRLLARGHQKQNILPVFNQAIASIITTCADIRPTAQTRQDNLMFHRKIHPDDPPSRAIHKIFRDTIISPSGQRDIQEIDCPGGGRVQFRDLTISYHGQTNLKSILAPRKGRFPDDFKVSTFLDSL